MICGKVVFDFFKTLNFFKLFTNCFVWVLSNMSVVPQGVFAAKKVRQNEQKLRAMGNLAPTNYSSKYMDSIWGMYNRYSVHNFKKNIDVDVFAFKGPQQDAVGPSTSVEKTPADKRGSLSASAKNLLPNPGCLHAGPLY